MQSRRRGSKPASPSTRVAVSSRRAAPILIVPMSRDLHQLAEARSLALHRAVAERRLLTLPASDLQREIIAAAIARDFAAT